MRGLPVVETKKRRVVLQPLQRRRWNHAQRWSWQHRCACPPYNCGRSSLAWPTNTGVEGLLMSTINSPASAELPAIRDCHRLQYHSGSARKSNLGKKHGFAGAAILNRRSPPTSSATRSKLPEIAMRSATLGSKMLVLCTGVVGCEISNTRR